MPIPGPTSSRPFAQVSWDMITNLPLSHGFDLILSMVDHGLTKGIILVPCTKLGMGSEQITTMYLNNVYKHFGLPDKLFSDRGSMFTSGMFRELMTQLGVQMAFTTAYHPQSDGTTERYNQEIEAYLSIYCTSHPEDWVEALPTIEFTHNNRRHAD